MARTWTHYQTLSVASGSDFIPWSRALVNGAGTEVYFIRTASPHQKVYSWNGGASLTDIAGTNFPVGVDVYTLFDLCIFDGNLFVAYSAAPVVGDCSIHRWQGGTSWDNEYTLEDESPPGQGWIGQGIGGVDSYPWPMDCDDSYMAIAGTISNTNTETFRRMWVRDTAGNYSVTQMPGPAYPAPGYQLVGKSKGSDYSGLVGYNRLSASNYQPVLIGGPSPWTYLTGAPIGQAIPIGYGNGLSFFSQNTPTGTTTWELKYSNDWGATLFTAGGLTFDENHERAEWKFKNLGDGVIMLATETHQVYTWDADTATFVEDGTTEDLDGSRTIFDFFRLNGQLFALTNSITANSVEMWTASEPACQASFYFGIEVPTFASDLPFCVRPGGLAIASLSHLAVLGTAGGGGQSVVYGQAPYVTWNDISGIVPTGTAVNSIRFV
jgi:hypothetical protein